MSSEINAILDLIAKAGGAEIKPFIQDAPEGRSFIMRPKVSNLGNGQIGVEWLAEQITSANKAEVLAPKIVTQAVKLQDCDSLCAYLNRFKNDESLMFADINTNTIVGIVDYHAKPGEDGKIAANHGAHRATLVLPFSIEWQVWKAIDGKLMSHLDFANHLEENDVDILPLGIMKDGQGNQVEDAPTTIHELIREMQVRSSYGASTAIRNGDYVNVEMQKGDDVTTKRNVALPLSIDLNIPVYFGEQPILMKALIRRKVEDGSLRLGIKLVRPEEKRQDEFKRIVAEIEHDTMLPAHYGTPA